MGDSDRSPQIQLEIDQEVFIDSVDDGDVVEDATVATEVTLFDRVGDAYVLEGAIVFAGYTKHSTSADSDETDDVSDALSFELNDDSVNHVHHRLPFVLRVPVKAQSRGIVNVNSRISSWRLEVIGAGWIRILGDLTVLGLKGDMGYHFECGAQEEGDLLFKQREAEETSSYEEAYEVDDPTTENPYESDSYDGNAYDSAGSRERDFGDEATAAENMSAIEDLPEWQPESSEDLQLTRGSEDDMDVGPAYGETDDDEEFEARHSKENSEADVISEARGGQEMVETRSPETVDHSESAKDFSSSELHRLDRLFGDQNTSTEVHRRAENEERSYAEAPDAQGSPADRSADSTDVHSTEPQEDTADRSFSDNENVVEFDFEHQVPDVGALQVQDTTETATSESASSDPAQSREQAQAGAAPNVSLGESADGEETRSESASVSSDMWSFVDFDGPDAKYTLRFVIMEDEASLEDVSVRMNCSPDDLARLNHLTRDTVVHPGQSVAVPQSEQQQEV